MRDKAISLLRRLHFPVMLMLTTFPPALLIASMSPDMPVHAPMLCVLCAAAIAACILLPAKRQLIAAALCSAGLLALSVRLGIPALLGIVCCLTLFASLRLSHGTLHTTPPVFYLCGVVSHLFTQAILRSSLTGETLYGFLAAPLCALTLVYLALLLLTFNGISLDNAALGRHRLPASVRRINALLTVLFLALALLLASMPAVISSVVFLWQMLRDALASLNALLMRLLPVGQDIGGGGMPGFMTIPTEVQPVTEPTFFAILLQRAAEVLTTVLVIAGSALLVYRLGILLRMLLRHLIRRLHSYVLIVSDDYVDEVSDTREYDGEHALTRPARARRRAGDYAQTPGGMIRARYAHLLRRHPQWSESSTARENLPPQAASLYEHARYSAHPVTREDAERFSADTRKL